MSCPPSLSTHTPLSPASPPPAPLPVSLTLASPSYFPQRYVQIIEAYKTLRNPVKRAAYDVH